MARMVAPPSPNVAHAPLPIEVRSFVKEYLTSWLGACLVLAAVSLSLYLYQMSTMATAGYDLQRYEVERDQWLARNEQARYELSKRRSLAWVESEAVTRLGMVRPERPAAVVPVDAATLALTAGLVTPTSPGGSKATGESPTRPTLQGDRSVGGRASSPIRGRPTDLSLADAMQRVMHTLVPR